MKRKPIGEILPPPHELAAPRDDVKVTLALSRRSVAFFKDHARRRRTKYQRMIRELLDRYVAHYGSPQGGSRRRGRRPARPQRQRRMSRRGLARSVRRRARTPPRR